MDIDDFMDITKPIKRANVSAASATYTYVPMNDAAFKKEYSKKRGEKGIGYSQNLKRQLERDMYEKSFSSTYAKHNRSSDEDDYAAEKASTSSNKYLLHHIPSEHRLANPNLVIHQFRAKILQTISENPVTIIKGETGCGKSTQVPQFILDECTARGEQCQILVTQPRRIAAKLVAERVARERRSQTGTQVGYQIGLEKLVSENTQLLFCTTGVALKKLINAKTMEHYTHIILDEVHERDEDMEFLLIVIKLFLSQDPYGTKVILMSATFDTEEFSNYFKLPNGPGRFKPAPTIDLKEARNFQIKQYYMEDIKLIANYATIDYETPGIDTSLYAVVPQLLNYFDKFDLHEQEQYLYTVLIFLPGIHEIKSLYNILMHNAKCEK